MVRWGKQIWFFTKKHSFSLEPATVVKSNWNTPQVKIGIQAVNIEMSLSHVYKSIIGSLLNLNDKYCLGNILIV